MFICKKLGEFEIMFGRISEALSSAADVVSYAIFQIKNKKFKKKNDFSWRHPHLNSKILNITGS